MPVPPATSIPEALAAPALGLEQATVAVLMGGRSSERDVSLSSGRMVLNALASPTTGEDLRGPLRVIAVELQADGRWRVGKRLMMPGEAVVALADVDVFFSALHGGEGEKRPRGMINADEGRVGGAGGPLDRRQDSRELSE